MKSERLRREIYHLVLTSEMNFIYWGWWGKFYSIAEKGIRTIVALISSGAVAAWAIWDSHPSTWQLLIGVLVVVTVIEPFLNIPRKISRTCELRKEWGEMNLFWEDLWRGSAWNDSNTAMQRISDLKRLQLKTEEKEAHLPDYQWLLRRAQNRVGYSRGIEMQWRTEDD